MVRPGLLCALILASCAAPKLDYTVPKLAAAPASALTIAELIERLGPPESPRESSAELQLVGVAIEVAGVCPPCEGPDPCAPCGPDSMHRLADAEGGPAVTVWTGMVVRDGLVRGRRYLVSGKVTARKDEWLVEAREVFEVPSDTHRE